MTTGVQVFAIQTALNEIRRVSPDVLSTFFFNEDGTLVAKDDDTDSEKASHAAKVFNDLSGYSDIIGGIESVTYCGSNACMGISRLGFSYIATVAPTESDKKHTSALMSVLIPTAMRIADNYQHATDLEIVPPIAPEFPETVPEKNEETRVEQTEESEPEVEQAEPELEYEPTPTEDPQATQFIIENLGGLLVAADTVRIDNEILLQWNDLYPNREIQEVDVETLNGQTTRCKFKPIKDSKLEGKGIIQMPQKLQAALQTSLGELVMVKPVIE